MIKESKEQKDIPLLNIYICNIGVPKNIKQVSFNRPERRNSNTIMAKDFNSSFSTRDRLRQKQSIRKHCT